MKTQLIIYSLFLLSKLWAAPDLGLDKLIADEIKKETSKSLLNLKTESDFLKEWGKPALKENQHWYYVVNDYKYALSLQFNKSIVTKIYYRFQNPSLTYKALLPHLKNVEKKMENMGTHEEGRTFSVQPSPEEKLIFKNSEKQTIDVLIWTKAGTK